MNPKLVQTAWFQPCLLLLWVVIGAVTRFAHLTTKPPWTDEFATLVFSLGHSFKTIPLNQVIALEDLMQPLQLPPQTADAVRQHLFAEDVHPPLYFILSNAWLRLFSADTGLISLWLARSLPALFGVASIPAMFGLSWLMLRSPVASHLTAALMTLSPFGVYLAQEARHYTLGILWVIASCGCFVVAVRHMQQRRAFPFWLAGLWVGVNGLGIATHYFFMLSLSAMALALIGLALYQTRENSKILLSSPWRRLYVVMLGTTIAAAIWLPLLQDIRSREITQWIRNVQPFNWLDLVNPLAQSLAAWVTMLVLLPVESDQLAVAIAAGVVMIAFILWITPQLWRGLQQQIVSAEGGSVRLMSGVLLGAIALFFFISYVLRTDITRGARYSFVYFPAAISLLGTSLMVLWRKSKHVVAIVLLFAFLSSLTVVNNLGYRKYYRPDVLLPVMMARSQNPILIATTQNTLVQTGEIMGIGWQFLQEESTAPQFLLAYERQNPCVINCAATATLQNVLAQHPTPIDLWLVNFHAPVKLKEQRCQLDSQPKVYASGYEYQLYHCGYRLPLVR